MLKSQAGYIGEFTVVDDHRAGKIVVALNGRINKAGKLQEGNSLLGLSNL